MSRVPHVVAYDPAWPGWFAEVRRTLEPLLAPWATTPVEHIGSTAVPGMPGKALLDVMAGVADPDAADSAGTALAGHGWLRRTHRVDAVLVVAVENGVDRVNLQLTTPGSDLWRERLAFRDALRADPRLVAEYAELKRTLLERTGGASYDSAGKRDFVRRVLAGAGVVLRDDRHAGRP